MALDNSVTFALLFVLAAVLSRALMWLYRRKFSVIHSAYIAFLTAAAIGCPTLTLWIGFDYAVGMFLPSLFAWLFLDLLIGSRRRKK